MFSCKFEKIFKNTCFAEHLPTAASVVSTEFLRKPNDFEIQRTGNRLLQITRKILDFLFMFYWFDTLLRFLS